MNILLSLSKFYYFIIIIINDFFYDLYIYKNVYLLAYSSGEILRLSVSLPVQYVSPVLVARKTALF